MRYLHEKVGEESMIDGGGSEGRGEMLQAGGLQPPRHDGVASIAAVVQQRSCGGGIALRHLATRVALRTSLRRQFSRSVRTCFAPNKIIKSKKKKKNCKDHQVINYYTIRFLRNYVGKYIKQ